MKKLKVLTLSATFAVGMAFGAASSANVVDFDDHQAVWSTTTTSLTSDIVSIVSNRSNGSVPPAFWLLGAAMVFLFRKPHSD